MRPMGLRRTGLAPATLAALLALALISPALAAAPRGADPSLAALYEPEDGVFKCFDGSASVSADRVNDDFCDCADGSDEPGTSACPTGTFYCRNVGYDPVRLPSRFVDDGVCDCCDGSDEAPGRCPDDCRERGREQLERLHAEVAAARAGAKARRALEAKGTGVIEKYHKELDRLEKEVEAHRMEKTTLEAERDRLQMKASEEAEAKKAEEEAKAPEAEPAQADEAAKEAGTEPAQADEAAKEAGTEPAQADEATRKAEVEAAQAEETAKELEVDARRAEEEEDDEIASHPAFASEATYIEDAWGAAGAASASGGAEAPSATASADEAAGDEAARAMDVMSQWIPGSRVGADVADEDASAQEPQPQPQMQPAEAPAAPANDDDEAAAAAAMAPKALVGEDILAYVPTFLRPRARALLERWAPTFEWIREKTECPAFRPKEEPRKLSVEEQRAEGRRRALELAARQKKRQEQAIASIREKEAAPKEANSLEDIQSRLASKTSWLRTLERDLAAARSRVRSLHGEPGAEQAGWAALADGPCLEVRDGKYVYEACPFGKATQVEGGSRTDLGEWTGIKRDDAGRLIGVYENGARCWNGPKRSLTVELRCAAANALSQIAEPSRCVYTGVLETPAACTADAVRRAHERLEERLRSTGLTAADLGKKSGWNWFSKKTGQEDKSEL